MPTPPPPSARNRYVTAIVDAVAEMSPQTRARLDGTLPPASVPVDTTAMAIEFTEARTALRDLGARSRALTELSSDWYWEHDADGRFTSISAQLPEKTGIHVEEMIGRTRWESNIRFVPEDRVRLQADMDARQPFYDFCFDRVLSNGNIRHLCISGVPIFDSAGRYCGYRGIGKDTTERRNEQAASPESQDFASAALDALADHVCVLDASGRIVAVNSAWRRFAEANKALRSGVFLGANYLDVCDHVRGNGRVDARAVAIGLRRVIAGDAAAFRHEYACDTPVRAFWFALKATRFELKGNALIVIAHEDVTESRNGERARALEHAVARCLAVSDDEPRVIGNVIREVCESQGWTCGLFARTDVAAGEPRVCAAWPLVAGDAASTTSSNDDARGGNKRRLIADVARRGESLWVEAGPPGESRTVPTATGEVRGGYGFVVAHERRVFGVLAFFSSQYHAADAGVEAAARVTGAQVARFLERTSIEAALRDSEARFRSLSDLSADWYWQQDEALRFTSSCNGTEIEAGMSQDADLGKTRWELDGALEANWDLHRRTLADRLPFHDFDMKRAFPDGTVRDIAISGAPIFDSGGAFRGYRGIGRDITLRRREERILALEHRVAQAIAAAGDESPVVEDVIKAICETQQWSWGAYFHVDEAAGVMLTKAVWSEQQDTANSLIALARAMRIERGQGVSGTVWQTGEPLWTVDGDFDARTLVPGAVHAAGYHGAFAFPAIAENRVIGVMLFMSATVVPPDARFVAAARMMGAQVGQCLQRRQALTALRESETRYRALTEMSSDWYWEQDADERFTCVSEGARIHAGIDVATLLGRRRWDSGIVYDASDRTRLETLMAAHLPFRDFEYRHGDSGSGARDVVISGEPMHDVSGRFLGYRGVGKDVTERRHVEVQSQFRAMLLNTVGDAVMAANLDERISYWNAAAEQLFGWSSAEALGRPMLEMVRPADPFHETGALPQVMSGRVWRGEKVGHHRDGRTFPVHLTLAPVIAASGAVCGLVSVSRDITESRRADQRIREGARQQALIAAFGRRALATATLEGLLEEAASVVVDGLGVAMCRVMQRVPNESSVIVRAQRGFGPLGTDARVIDPETVRLLHAAGAPVIVGDYASAAEVSPLFASHGVSSAVSVVIGGDDGPFGVIGAYARGTGCFDAGSGGFLQSIANTLAAAIGRLVASEKAVYLSQYDILTGLPNRILFADRLEFAMAQARHNASNVAVMFVDLDRFKDVNATFGYGVGDRVLALVAARLRDCAPSVDTTGRLGGDQFSIMLPALDRADDATLAAQRVIDGMATPFAVDGYEVAVTCSIGIAVFPADGVDPETLVNNAEAAMNLAQDGGRNGIHFFTEEINARITLRLGVEAELRNAIANDEFLLHYQPEVSLDTGRIIGVEALIRWQHPSRGLLSPIDFIPVAEESGLIVPIGRWVAKTACAQLAQWRQAGHRELFVAINVSPMEIRRGKVIESIGEALALSSLEPRHLEIELTETLIMDDAESFVRTLEALKAIGVTIAIDDFGTGYSSLSYLKRFPVDKVKIDRIFTRDIVTDVDDAAIVQAIIAMSHHLKLVVTAEGVETDEQAAFLRRSHCDIVQGFLFSKPVTAHKFGQLLDSQGTIPLLPKSRNASRTLLLVDDEENNLHALKRALRRDGYDIHTATSGQQALEVLARTPTAVIVSDQRMPNMSGTELLMRAKSLYPKTVRVILSGYTDLTSITASINDGAIYKFLTKPWEETTLRDTIRAAFRLHEQESTQQAPTADIAMETPD
ncbi:MAG: EAL domain-containing protein [Betaproteobacteria bacterium]